MGAVRTNVVGVMIFQGNMYGVEVNTWSNGDYILNTYYRTAVKIIGEDIKFHAIRPLVLDRNNNTFVADNSLFNIILPKGLAPYFIEDINKIVTLEDSNGKS